MRLNSDGNAEANGAGPEPPIVGGTREAMVERLMWAEGGYGFGICSVTASMMWAMDEPGPDKPDLKSTVAIHGNPAKYTDEELAKLVAFADRHDAKYDEMFRYRRGCNMIIFDKRDDGAWMRKRLTWEYGPMYSKTLDEAIAVFEK